MNDPRRVLIVEDDNGIALVLEEALREAGYVTHRARTLAERDEALRDDSFDLMISDVILPDGDALDTMPDVSMPIIVLSAQNTLDTALRAEKSGSYEYLPKPFDIDVLCARVRDALTVTRDPADPRDDHGPEAAGIVGRSQSMQDVFRTMARVASNDLAVLITGESGTGKELVARAIHQNSRRARAPFVAINMAAIPRDLIEAELFGYEKGAFTGAAQRHAGHFERADGGTLFLDEIGDMPSEAQSRLLRVLQSGEFQPVGSARARRADVRIVAATHRDLRQLVQDGAFREDLYFRLAVIPIDVPPLRTRRDDIPALVTAFVRQRVSEGFANRTFGDDALSALQAHAWPGNVRELENVVSRILALGRADHVTAATVQQALGGAAPDMQPVADIEIALARSIEAWVTQALQAGVINVDTAMLAICEPPMLRAVLKAVGGNQVRAAALLGLNRNTLRKRLVQYGITPQTDP